MSVDETNKKLVSSTLSLHRWRFYSRTQRLGESIEVYYESLVQLSKFCNFIDVQESLVDKLIHGVINDKLKHELIFCGTRDVEKLLTICKSFEESTVSVVPALSQNRLKPSELTQVQGNSTCNQVSFTTNTIVNVHVLSVALDSAVRLLYRLIFNDKLK